MSFFFVITKRSGSILPKRPGDLVYYNAFTGSMATVMVKHDPDEWRFFIDTSKTTLKALLHHNGNCCEVHMYIEKAICLTKWRQNMYTKARKVSDDAQ